MSALTNLLDIIRLARLRLDDLPGDSVRQDWENDDTGLKWTNWELATYANQAQEEVAARVPIQDSDTAECCEIALSLADGPIYNTHGQILYIKRIRLDGESMDLGKTREEEMDQNFPAWEDQDADTPTRYLDNRDEDKIYFWPPPNGNFTAKLEVGRLPLTSMRWDHRHIDKPEIKSKHWFDLVDYMVHLAYLKRDTETFDEKASNRALQVFNLKFGDRPNRRIEKENEVERNRPRRVRAYYF